MKQSPQWIYEEVYCQRGDVENRIKELKALAINRVSCTGFWANQLRVLMTAAAYVLMQEIRLAAALTSMARAQAWTIRERLLKLGARVVSSVRRLVLHLPQAFPGRQSSRKWLLRWALRLDKQKHRQPTTQSAALLETVGDYHAQKSM